MRPLVVLTGQGISRADGLDLERELRDAIEEEARRCFDLPRDSGTLDDVFSAARRHSMQYLEALVRATRKTCIAARESGVHVHHSEVFGALRDAAANRVVVHVTTNIDGIATTVAVKVFGAVWRPVERYGEEIPIADIRRDVLEVFAAGRGQSFTCPSTARPVSQPSKACPSGRARSASCRRACNTTPRTQRSRRASGRRWRRSKR